MLDTSVHLLLYVLFLFYVGEKSLAQLGSQAENCL